MTHDRLLRLGMETTINAPLAATAMRHLRAEIVPFARGDEDDAEDDDWNAGLQDGPRPEELSRRIIALVAAAAALAAAVPGQVDVPDGSPLSAAEEAAHQSRAVLEGFSASVMAVVEAKLPGLLRELDAWVSGEAGIEAGAGLAAVERDLLSTIRSYVTANVAEIRAGINRAISEWHAAGGTDISDLRAVVQDALEDLDWRIKRIVRTEIQSAYQDLVKAAARKTGTQRVLREAMPDACDECIGLEGEWDIDDAAAWETHPNCRCVFTLLSTGETVEGDLAEFSGPAFPLEAVG